MATVSVIIPLFNKEAYIARAIKSVINQTYQDYELIVIDDGSTDRGAEVVSSFQDPRLKMVTQRNSGPGAARNRGIEESTAPYLAFLDADDEWLPEFLQRYVGVIVAEPECDYVVGPHFESTDKADKSDEWEKLGVCEGPWSLPENVSHVQYHELLSKLHCIGAMLSSRGVIERYGGFYSKDRCRYGEDRYLQMQMLLNHRLYRLLEPLAWYHNETDGVSTIERSPRPLLPVLTDPNPVRRSCPQNFRPMLETWLASHALVYASEYLEAGNLSIAKDLICRFPRMRKNRRKFIVLIFLYVKSALRRFFSTDRY